MKERFKSVVCVDLLLKRKHNNKTYILLMNRINTDSNNGEYELPGGHLEYNEDIYTAMIREAKEELLIDLKQEELKIVEVFHHYTGNRINFIFEADIANHNPQIGEKDKCDELLWTEIDNLPDKTNEKMKTIINNFVKNIYYDKL